MGSWADVASTASTLQRAKTHPFAVALYRTEATEAARSELIAHLPTLAAVSRLSLIINGGVVRSADGKNWLWVQPDAGAQGQKLIRHKPGWGWSCRRCHREIEGEVEHRPVECPYCRAHGRHLEGHEVPVYYLSEPPRGGTANYDGGIGRVDLLVSFGFWLKSVSPKPLVYRAVDLWILGVSLRDAAQKLNRCHTWCATVVDAVRQEWERP